MEEFEWRKIFLFATKTILIEIVSLEKVQTKNYISCLYKLSGALVFVFVYLFKLLKCINYECASINCTICIGSLGLICRRWLVNIIFVFFIICYHFIRTTPRHCRDSWSNQTIIPHEFETKETVLSYKLKSQFFSYIKSDLYSFRSLLPG